MQNRELARKHIDRRLSRLMPAKDFSRPPKGWIRAIRDAVGMTSQQLARRLGVSQPRVAALEKAEQQGSVTIASLARAAEALDCTLVYAMLPNRTLESMVKDRANKVATELISSVDHSMRLEDQSVDERDFLFERDQLADDLLRGNLHRLWDAN